MKRFLALLAISAAVLLSFGAAFAADVTLKAESLVLSGSEDDLIGSSSTEPDGKPDAVFALTVSGAQAIRDITLKNETTGVSWSASSPKNLLVVKNSKGEILNKSGRMTITPVIIAAKFTLIINDAVSAVPENSDFSATVTLIDGSTTAASTSVASLAPSGVPLPPRPVRQATEADSMTAEYKGESAYDFAGQSKKAASNMNADSFITTAVNAKGRVTGVRVTNAKNNKQWDTMSDSGNPLAVVMTADGKKLNGANGAVAFDIDGAKELRVAFDEDKDKNTGPYKVALLFSDGRLVESAAAKADAAATASSASEKGERAVTFVSQKPESVAVDLVGKNKKHGANGAKDMALKINVEGKGTIKAIVLADSSSAGWDTLASNNGRWLLGVRDGNKFLNAENGTVDIKIDGAKNYQLLMQNNGKLSAASGKLLLTVTWGDGEVTETELKW